MERLTKNIITPESAKQELWKKNKRDVKDALMLCFGTLVLAALDAAVVALGEHLFESLLLTILLSAVPIGMTGLIAYAGVTQLVRAIKQKKRLDRGEIAVTTGHLQYKKTFNPRRAPMQFYLHFAGFKDVEVKEFTHEHASGGDAFLLFHYEGEKEIKLCYPAKTYEYKE